MNSYDIDFLHELFMSLCAKLILGSSQRWVDQYLVSIFCVKEKKNKKKKCILEE